MFRISLLLSICAYAGAFTVPSSLVRFFTLGLERLVACKQAFHVYLLQEVKEKDHCCMSCTNMQRNPSEEIERSQGHGAAHKPSLEMLPSCKGQLALNSMHDHHSCNFPGEIKYAPKSQTCFDFHVAHREP
jgi:hypothetical protein